MRWMAMVLGLGLVCAGCKDNEEEPVEVATDEAKAEEGDDKGEADEVAKSDDEASEDAETKTPKADEDEDEDDEGEDTEEGGLTKTADASTKPTASPKAPPFGSGGLSACCAALDVQSQSTSGSNASRIAAASRQCFHLDGLVAQGKTTKGAALSQLKALAGVAPAACN